ncbi:MAG: hypothetical protein JRF43_02370 [Deltaproteobacteria bacterium]|nr:hypothetical protein [Deltaproteobacteria bacterium]
MHCVALIPNPIGLLVLGTVGYFLYKSGKKSGKQETEESKSGAEKAAKA